MAQAAIFTPLPIGVKLAKILTIGPSAFKKGAIASVRAVNELAVTIAPRSPLYSDLVIAAVASINPVNPALAPR